MGRPLYQAGNDGDQNKIGAFNQAVCIGTALSLGAQSLRTAVANDTVVLESKALLVLSAYSVDGTVTGPLTPVDGAPAAGEVAVDQLGNIVFNAADAVAEVELVYIIAEGDSISAGGVADATGLYSFPNSSTARIITSATANGVARTVVDRGAAPAAGEVALTVDGSGAQFNVADAGAEVTVDYIEFPTDSVINRLNGDVDF